MICATISTSSTEAQRYFRESLATSDYYAEKGNSPGRWGGKLAQELGLKGAVAARDFKALTENRHPQTGKQLSARDRANRRVGVDFTFNPCKSFSVASLNDPRLEKALLAAVDATLAEMETHVQARVRGANKQDDENRPTQNWVYARFLHHETRALADQSADVHLHVHAFVFNYTQDDVSGKVKAAQLGQVHELLPYFQARFHHDLAHRVRELGYGITVNGQGGWELEGLTPETLEKFSRRRQEILQEAERRNLKTKSLFSKLGVMTRRGKVQSNLTAEQLREAWLNRLTPSERKALNQLQGQPSKLLHTQPKAALDHSLNHHLERTAAVPYYQLKTTLLQQSMGFAPAEVESSIQQRKDLLKAEQSFNPLVTTGAVYKEEQALAKFAREGLWACGPLGQAQERAPATALEQVLASHHRITVVEGLAGTGKTTLIHVAVKQMEQAGNQVFLFAPTAEASRGVLASEGFTNAQTLQKLLTDKQLQRQTKGAVLWVDEAGLMSNPQFYALIKLAQRNGNRLVLSGDANQHGSVQRGSPLDLLRSHAGLQPIRLTEIRRQTGEYKAAVQLVVKGQLSQAFEQLDRMGAFREASSEESHAAVAKSYVQALEQRKSVLVVCPTHREGSEVNDALRKALQQAGHLSTKEQRYIRLQQLDHTEAQRKQPQNYQPLQVVQFHQNVPGFPRGSRVVVQKVEGSQVQVLTDKGKTQTLPLNAAAHFSVYEQKSFALAVGDKLRITQNAQLGSKRLNNGQLHEVKGFDAQRQPILSNGIALPVHFGYWNHGYVLTSQASQGKTVDRVIVVQSAKSFGAASQNQFYVSLSRARKEVEIYTDDKQGLLRVVREAEARRMALDLPSKQQPLWQQRLQQTLSHLTTRLRYLGLRNRQMGNNPQLTQPHTPTLTASGHAQSLR